MVDQLRQRGGEQGSIILMKAGFKYREQKNDGYRSYRLICPKAEKQ